jgi:deoxycytidylate deaminase
VSNTPDNVNELFIAVVAAVGTDIEQVTAQIGTCLREYEYESIDIRLSNFLAESATANFKGLPIDERLWEAMTAGDELRRKWDRDDALALQAISEIVAIREKRAKPLSADAPEGELCESLDRHAYVIRSLKTPDELETLRAVYGPRLIVIAAFSPRDQRLEHLEKEIEKGRKSNLKSTWAHQAKDLIDRDEKEEGHRGQDVSGTFHRADFFIRGWNEEVIETDLTRAFEILFGDPYRTPTKDEYCQFMAAGAALHSSEPGRQVGVAIATPEGSLISLGANDVPKVFGGTYWDGENGRREFEKSDFDTNRKHFDELGERLATAVDDRLGEEIGEGLDEAETKRMKELRAAMVSSLPQILRAAGLKELTEFGRAVHAEMNALLDAARRGISVDGATLYSTTFPCHNCARHIIGSGIRRIVFVEPYVKSRALELHGEDLSVDESKVDKTKIKVDAFVGVAPRRYQDMFDAFARERLGHVGRKDDADGRLLKLDKASAVPVFNDSGLVHFRTLLREYRSKEKIALVHYENCVTAAVPSGTTANI